MISKRVRSIVFVTITLLFGLHIFRVFLPTVIWYLGQFLVAEQLALFALGTFALSLFTPLIYRLLGERRILILTAGGLALVRLGLQFANTPLTQLGLATIGLALWGWFIPFWLQSPRNRSQANDLPVMVVAFPLTYLLDTFSRTLLWSYDLAWQRGFWPVVVASGLVVLVLVLLWYELSEGPIGGPAEEPALGGVLPFLGLGPFLYLTLSQLNNPAALSAATGWGDTAAHLAVNGFTAMGALACVWASGWPAQRRWLAALLSGGVLTGALVLSYTHTGPGWLVYLLAAPTIWLCLGWLLTGTTRRKPLRLGLWRTSLATFLALLIMLAIVFLVAQFDMFSMIIVAGALICLTTTWSAWGQEKPDTALFAEAVRLVGMSAQVLLVGAVLWSVASPTPQAMAPPSNQPLRVMTYNIHQGIDADMKLDLQAIAEAIAEQNPDVVALNEVNRARATNGFVDVLPTISRHLGMPYVFGANYADGQYGNAVLSRYPILSWDNTHYTHNTTEVRGLLRAVIQTAEGSITFYATHLDHLASPEDVRAEQVIEALAVWDGNLHSVLLGDLNARADTPELQPIYHAGFVDVLWVTGQEAVFTFWDPIPISSKRIDYIFLTPDLTVEDAWVVLTRASDHLPVAADIRP
ncbi:MAG: endonuclease/exonuclease/phosphatase family protein [Chloroflexota bacterium]